MVDEKTSQEAIELKPTEATPSGTEAVPPTTPGAANEVAPAPAAVKPPPMPKTKIVITHEKDAAIIGITQDKCDPRFFKAQGELLAIIQKVPDFLEEAIKSWKESPKNPEAKLPLPEPKVVSPAQASTKATASRPATPAKSAVTQQKFF